MLSPETLEALRRLCDTIPSSDHILIDLDDKSEQFVITLRVKSAATGKWAYPSYRFSREWAEETPGAKECEVPGLIGHSFYMPAGFVSALRIANAFPPERIEFANELSQATYFAAIAAFATGLKRATINAEWQAKQTVPAHNLRIKEGIELAPYQEVAAALGAMSSAFAFWMEQGTGKTPVTITTLATWIAENPGKYHRILVVSPRNVVYNWLTELKFFSAEPVKADAIRGGEIKRIAKLAAVLKPEEGYRAGIAVMNYEGVMAMQQVITAIPWDIIVLDEAHSIKATTSKRTRFFLNELRDNVPRRLELTGTPIANTPMDLWSQLEFLGAGTSGFTREKSFREYFAKLRKNAHTGFDQIVGMQNVPVLKDIIARNAFVIRKKEAMPWLPEKVYQVEEVEMTPRQRDTYKQLAEALALEIEEDLDSEAGPRQLLIQNVLTKLLRLAQVTSGFISWDPVRDADGNILRPRVIEDFPENPKIDWCIDKIKNQPENEKLLFWSWMTHDIDALAARCAAEGIEFVKFDGSVNDEARREAERRFNCDPKCRVFIGNPSAGGTGLNLLGHDPKNPDDYDTDATCTVYIAQNWNAVHRAQSGDRNHRRGTRKTVTEITLVCSETIDEDIHERVSHKRAVAFEISDIRSLLLKLRGDLI
jgi:SNF2 family DNA or RNA helicase